MVNAGDELKISARRNHSNSDRGLEPKTNLSFADARLSKYLASWESRYIAQMQSPMIAVPFKQTTQIDWIQPLQSYIRKVYSDNSESYADECNTLNRLRQDVREVSRDSTAGRDLLCRYYRQLELLDLRLPVNEDHIKISFTWSVSPVAPQVYTWLIFTLLRSRYDAFTQKPTSQYSLAYEKASVMSNISTALSCHAALQDRSDDAGQKSAYHSFQASAGMFTYINKNFLHAPSTDLSCDTVKTLITLMLAQAQEVFTEKQIRDGRKVSLLAKLASQAALLYTQATEGIQEEVFMNIFWLQVCQIKANHLSSIAQYYQALADDDADSHGIAIARLQIAERECRDACRITNAFPTSVSTASNLASDTRAAFFQLTSKHATNVYKNLISFKQDNDFVCQIVPAEASLSAIPKLAAAKAIPVRDLYQGQDIERIIGPDIFQKIVPIAVTEQASLYDEEKAKLMRAEAENVETANGEMAASLDYLKLPGSLIVLKGGMDQKITVDDDFRTWCEDLADYEPFGKAFDVLQSDKTSALNILTSCSRHLDQEESTCEKMRSKYGVDWTQQPSSRLTTTFRSDIRSYRDAVNEASESDARLSSTYRQYESDFDEMRSAGEINEADILYQRAMLNAGAQKGKGKGVVGSPLSASLLDKDFGEDSISVMDQISKVEDLLRKLELVKRDRSQVLGDLKEKVSLSRSITRVACSYSLTQAHNDDISTPLILSQATASNHGNQLFQSELDKFRPHEQRILQATHKQTALVKELTRTYSALLQDKRVRSEQTKYENFTRQRNTVLTKYKRVCQAFNDLIDGLIRAQGFYCEMKHAVENLKTNVEAFVKNRRSEGAQLLAQIERGRQSTAPSSDDRQPERSKDLMERTAMSSTVKAQNTHLTLPSRPSQSYDYPSGSPSTPPPHRPISNRQQHIHSLEKIT